MERVPKQTGGVATENWCASRSCGQATGVLKSEEYGQSCQQELEEVREKNVR